MRLLLSFLLLMAGPLMARAQTKSARDNTASTASKMKGLVVNADESDRDIEADTLDLRGHVQVIYKDQHLSCDHARLNFRAKTLEAEGRVLLTGPKATVTAEKIFLDYESNAGIIYDGSVRSGNVYFEGGQITRQSETEYMADSSRFTTCTNCPESWSFSGQRIRAELGGYAYIKNSFLRIAGWPIFWLPYLIVPLKSERQTGLLTPGFGQSNTGGLALSESFFWAMSKSQDATISLTNYELRGTKGLLDYRYVLDQNSKGEMNVGSLRDRVFATDTRVNQFRGPSEQGKTIDRWFLRYEHYYELPDNYVQRTQLNNASDLQYPRDFPLETQNHGDPAMENRMSVTKNTRDQHYSLDSNYYVNMLQADPLAGNSDAVHRLPELRFSQAMTPVGNGNLGLLYTLDADYTNFSRNNFAYDQMDRAYDSSMKNAKNPADLRQVNHVCSASYNPTNPDGTPNPWYNDPNCHAVRTGPYDPDRDIIRTGQRLDMTGTLYRPIKLANSFDLLPKLSFRETNYLFNVGDQRSNSRNYIRAELAARSTFSRIYGSTGPGSFERLKHEIVPEVTYTTIPWFNQPYHPFFGNRTNDQQQAPFFSQQSVSDSDVSSPFGVQFDSNDRVYDRQLVTLGFTNRLIQKRWVQGTPEYRQVVYWKLAQSYDFYEARYGDRKQPYSDLSSDLRVGFDHVQFYSQLSYYPYQQVTNSNSRFRLLNDNGEFGELAYHLAYNISPGQESDAETRTEDYALSLGKRFRFIELMGRVTYDINPPKDDPSRKIKSYGYGAQVKLPGDCWYFTITQYRMTDGDTNFGATFEFIWDGQKKPHLPEDLLDRLSF